ncbi:MAG: hypothetical protein G01um10147_1040 [Microgenomates group bacterium Gr01-1014_7]|nr:MAG: hypothetical protein G01um10147_1040 [Microgenomates group bacterium Gr01-1014_7]
MPVFDRERPEVDTVYESPKDSYTVRKETEIPLSDLTPTLREAIGKTSALSLLAGTVRVFAAEVKGGEWTHYSQKSHEESGRDGDYATRKIGADGAKDNTFYGIDPDGKVTIAKPRPPRIKLNFQKELEDSPISSIVDFLNRPYGVEGTITLEPVAGSNQTQPVLRYTEVRPDRLIGLLSGDIKSPESKLPNKNISILPNFRNAFPGIIPSFRRNLPPK